MIAELHPTHPTEPTPIYAAVVDLRTRRPILRVVPGGSDPIPRCRPTARRLAILNDGTGVSGAVTWNA